MYGMEAIVIKATSQKKRQLDPALYAIIAAASREKGKELQAQLTPLMQYVEQTHLHKMGGGRGMGYHPFCAIPLTP